MGDSSGDLTHFADGHSLQMLSLGDHYGMHGPRWPYLKVWQLVMALAEPLSPRGLSTSRILAGTFSHVDGSVPRGQEQKLQTSLGACSYTSPQCRFSCILLVKQVTKTAQIQGFGERICPADERSSKVTVAKKHFNVDEKNHGRCFYKQLPQLGKCLSPLRAEKEVEKAA